MMFKDFDLTFTEVVSSFVREQYGQANCILEYGSGGSTILGASLGKTVITTESSAEWLVELMGSYKERKYPGDIIPVYTDVGETKEWGYPVDDAKWRNWLSYSVKAWRYCAEHKVDPDIVLVDGRFRVACFISSCINIKKPTRILFDDYVERPHYHSVERILKPIKIVDSRMAVFDVEPGMVDVKYLLDQLGTFYTPA